jgi:hypothetical protein
VGVVVGNYITPVENSTHSFMKGYDMPARDGTGPTGSGPFGRGFGPCGDIKRERLDDQQPGMGMAHRRGRRFANRNPRWGLSANSADEEKQALHNRLDSLKKQLDEVMHRLEAFNKSSE